MKRQLTRIQRDMVGYMRLKDSPICAESAERAWESGQTWWPDDRATACVKGARKWLKIANRQACEKGAA